MQVVSNRSRADLCTCMYGMHRSVTDGCEWFGDVSCSAILAYNKAILYISVVSLKMSLERKLVFCLANKVALSNA